MRLKPAFAALTGADPDALRRHEAEDGLVHVGALTLTKTADGLIDAKLVLSWLLGALGAPGALVGALTPVREAGALLPQLAMAGLVRRAPLRKRVWAAAAAAQGLAALGIAAAALLLEGAVAGAVIVGLLGLLATGRALASLSQKDALARTIQKGRRGAVTGIAGATAALAAFAVGLAMAAGLFEAAVTPLALIVAAGGVAFLLGAALFLRLHEPRSEPEDDEDGGGLRALLRPLRDAPQLRIFIAARALLAATALAPPFVVMLSHAAERTALDQLGPLVMAATAANFVAAYLWGRLSDRSSRRTLIVAGLGSAMALAAAGLAGLRWDGLGGAAGAAAAVFAVQIGYQGVRAGRKLHLTDMAGDEDRARWTALSNSIIGALLLAGAGFGLLADLAGPETVLLVFAGMSALGALVATRLDEVQQESEG